MLNLETAVLRFNFMKWWHVDTALNISNSNFKFYSIYYSWPEHKSVIGASHKGAPFWPYYNADTSNLIP